MARIDSIRVSDLPAHRLESGNSRVDVLTGLGGAVHRIVLEAIDILAPDSPAELLANPWFRGRLLFPFNDRIPGGRYTWKGRHLKLPINSPEDGSALHGLVYNRPFRVVESSSGPADEATLKLSVRLSPFGNPGYPFDVTLDSSYRLGPSEFALELEAGNPGKEPAPLAFGWHPYFTLDETIDGLLLRADFEEFVPVDESLMPSSDRRSVRGTRYDFRKGGPVGSAPIDIALCAPADGQVTLQSRTRVLKMKIEGEAFRYVQVFTHPDRKSIAIEPITGATNSFNIPGLGLRIIEPGETLAGRVTLRLSQR